METRVPFESPSVSLEALRGWPLSTNLQMTTLDSRKTGRTLNLGQQEEDGKAAETVYQRWFPEKIWIFFFCH